MHIQLDASQTSLHAVNFLQRDHGRVRHSWRLRMFSEETSLPVRSDSLFGAGRQVGVCLHSSVRWELNTHIHIYTRSITLTPDARKSSGNWVASTAKPYHAWLSPDFASFSRLAWSHHHSPSSPSARLYPSLTHKHTHSHTGTTHPYPNIACQAITQGVHVLPPCAKWSDRCKYC